MDSKNIKYIPGLDHIRAYAAILIIIYHSICLISTHQNNVTFTLTTNTWIYSKNFLSPLLIEGHTAVALFMVSSGFIFSLITYGKEIYYFKFILNRVLRIYPLFIFILIIGISVYPSSFDFIIFLQTIFGFAQIQHNSLNIGPFSGISWAISVEFTFYLIFPFLLLITKNRKNFLKLILIFFIFRLFGFLLTNQSVYFSYFTILGRIDQFLIGMLTSIIYLKFKDYKFLKNKFISLFFLFFCIISIFFIMFKFNQLGGFPVEKWWKIIWVDIEAIMWASFIFFYLKTFNKKIFILNRVGEISFSLYLLHPIVISIFLLKRFYIIFTTNTFLNSILNSIVFIIPITIFISYFTYNLIEKPFLNLRVKYFKS